MTEISRPDLARGAARAGVLLGIVLAVWPAHALRLGPASALSAVGEPLRLEIQVAGLSEAQAAAVKVDLAPASAFRAAAMDYPEVLEGAEVVLARGQDGRPVLRVSSSRSARQPYLDLIVQARWPSGRLERQYTVLLEARASDPEGQRIAALADSVAPGRVPVPARIQPAPSVAAPGAPQAVAPVATPGSPRAVPTGATTTPAVSHSVVVERYTVRPGDTLLGIARRKLLNFKKRHGDAPCDFSGARGWGVGAGPPRERLQLPVGVPLPAACLARRACGPSTWPGLL